MLEEDDIVLQTRAKREVPKRIYIYEKNDIVKQLSSIGQRVYHTSHRKPNGTVHKPKKPHQTQEILNNQDGQLTEPFSNGDDYVWNTAHVKDESLSDQHHADKICALDSKHLTEIWKEIRNSNVDKQSPTGPFQQSSVNYEKISLQKDAKSDHKRKVNTHFERLMEKLKTQKMSSRRSESRNQYKNVSNSLNLESREQKHIGNLILKNNLNTSFCVSDLRNQKITVNKPKPKFGEKNSLEFMKLKKSNNIEARTKSGVYLQSEQLRNSLVYQSKQDQFGLSSKEVTSVLSTNKSLKSKTKTHFENSPVELRLKKRLSKQQIDFYEDYVNRTVENEHIKNHAVKSLNESILSNKSTSKQAKRQFSKTPISGHQSYNLDDYVSATYENIEAASKFIKQTEQQTMEAVNDKIMNQIIQKDAPKEYIIKQYTSQLLNRGPRRVRKSTDFMKEYPVESSLNASFKVTDSNNGNKIAQRIEENINRKKPKKFKFSGALLNNSNQRGANRRQILQFHREMVQENNKMKYDIVRMKGNRKVDILRSGQNLGSQSIKVSEGNSKSVLKASSVQRSSQRQAEVADEIEDEVNDYAIDPPENPTQSSFKQRSPMTIKSSNRQHSGHSRHETKISEKEKTNLFDLAYEPKHSGRIQSSQNRRPQKLSLTKKVSFENTLIQGNQRQELTTKSPKSYQLPNFY